MNAPLQNGLQAAVAKAHKKPKVFWTVKEQALVAAETDRLLLGADPAHTNLGPLIKAAQLALPEHRRRCVNSATIGLVREALLAKAPAPEPAGVPDVPRTPALYRVSRVFTTAEEALLELTRNPGTTVTSEAGGCWMVTTPAISVEQTLLILTRGRDDISVTEVTL